MSKREKGPAPEPSNIWRTDEQRQGGEAFREEVAREFPPGASELDGTSRREFIQLVGASLALAGVGTVAGCKDPPPNILPYNAKPLDVNPGTPLHYATALTHGGIGSGVLVTAWEGRPTKVEGNPDHPINRGAATVHDQAAILGLYDQDRAKLVKHAGRGSTWVDFCKFVDAEMASHKDDGGAKVAFLVEPSASPLLASLEKRIRAELPKARWFGWSAVNSDNAYEGAKLAFGKPYETQHDLSKAKVIVSLDADFLGGWPTSIHLQRAFSDKRLPGPDMNRLYVAEAALTCTGASADHRLRLRASDIGQLARALHAAVTGGSASLNDAKASAWVKAVAKDLANAGGAGVVLVGPRQPAAVHALAHAINAQLKSAAVSYTAPLLPEYEPLDALVAELNGGRISTLFITAWNPVYTAPADVPLKAALGKVPNAIYLAMHEDETAKQSAWILPRAHELESWGDARAIDGTITLQQPLTNPLFGGVSAAELLASVLGEGGVGGEKLLRASHQMDEMAWQRQLQRGIVDNTALPAETPTVQAAAITSAAEKLPAAPTGIELNFVADYKVWDGRYGNNGWLQELPEPITKLTWSNALVMSRATADKLGVVKGDICGVKVHDREIQAQALPWPGHADESVTLALGYGRSHTTEKLACDVGANAYAVRFNGARWIDGANIGRVGKGEKLAVTQEHWQMDGRPMALQLKNAQISGRKKLPIVEETAGPVQSMYKPHEYTGFQWAMAIDLSKCTGCSACVIACQSENNIPVVGMDQVRKSREMHWLRIDEYFITHEPMKVGQPLPDVEPESVIFQPLACVHCEKAPCEYVCPVEATAHSDEGLNEMLYNRCVGTRYCSNNCPYKVRRFNYLDLHPEVPPIERMAMNPDVTVRSRGVMEKCSYCVQRIERVRIEKRVAGKPILDGDIVTACQATCPSRAITFGSLHDKESVVSKQHEDIRAYDLLHELGTRPRTAYLARVKNTNPELDNG